MKVRTKAEIHDHVFDEYDHQNLKPNTVYPVIGINEEYYRILNERDDPILYPKYLFTVVDATVPESWKRRDFDEGTYYIDPPEMSERGFWCHFDEGKPEAIANFRAYRERVNELGE